jgi:hypothetical protein
MSPSSGPNALKRSQSAFNLHSFQLGSSDTYKVQPQAEADKLKSAMSYADLLMLLGTNQPDAAGAVAGVGALSIVIALAAGG